jgi:hypothetical protein
VVTGSVRPESVQSKKAGWMVEQTAEAPVGWYHDGTGRCWSWDGAAWSEWTGNAYAPVAGPSGGGQRWVDPTFPATGSGRYPSRQKRKGAIVVALALVIALFVGGSRVATHREIFVIHGTGTTAHARPAPQP